MLRTTTAMLLLLLPAASALAEIKTRTVEYKHGDLTLRGYFAWDDALSGKRPGVLVVHEWWGLNDYARMRAEKLAALGYVAFALDMYGEGKVTEHAQEASAWAGQVRANAGEWQARGRAGLEVLRGHELVDVSRLAAIGYCFGGATAIKMAYAGEDLDGVVSFHGALPVAEGDEAKQVKAKMLICHGALDGFVPEEQCQKFRAGLDAAGVDYEMVYYAGARHSFTNPGADARGIDGLKYNRLADERSWREMQAFFAEIFGK